MAITVPQAVRGVPAGVWLGALAVGGLALLVWHDWQTNADEDAAWLDPQQPALQLDAPTAKIPAVRPRSREYPSCLSAWAGTKIGDC